MDIFLFLYSFALHVTVHAHCLSRLTNCRHIYTSVCRTVPVCFPNRAPYSGLCLMPQQTGPGVDMPLPAMAVFLGLIYRRPDCRLGRGRQASLRPVNKFKSARGGQGCVVFGEHTTSVSGDGELLPAVYDGSTPLHPPRLPTSSRST